MTTHRRAPIAIAAIAAGLALAAAASTITPDAQRHFASASPQGDETANAAMIGTLRHYIDNGHTVAVTANPDGSSTVRVAAQDGGLAFAFRIEADEAADYAGLITEP